jgi:hypothetical protein
MNAFYLAAAVIVITGISHVVLGMTIDKVRDAATNNPGRLRGVTPQEALAKVAQWETTRKRLWPLALIVAGGLVAFGFFGK